MTFNFNDLTSLNVSPALTESELNLINSGDGVRLQANNRTFTAGAITMNFTQAPNTAGAGFSHYGALTTLTIGKFTSINFLATGGCVLSSINFNRSSDIYLPTGQPGRFNSNTTWISQDNNNVTALTLSKGAQDSQMDKITVTYLRPSTPLDFLSSNPVAGSTYVGVFKSMTLNFSTAVTKINNASSIALTGTYADGNVINQTMTAKASGTTVTLTAATAIERDATLKVRVPAGTFENSEGSTNIETIDIAFATLAKRDVFNPISIEPVPGLVGELPQEIRLTFNNFASVGTGVAKFKQGPVESGEELESYLSFPSSSIEVDAENKKIGMIKHENGRQVEASTWTIEIPEGLFHNQYYQVDDHEDRWNEAMTITYIVDGSQSGPQDSQTLKAAKEMLNLTGVGYPKTSTVAYQALDALVKAEETPDDEALAAAMDNLYNETDVVMPTVGQWYYLAGVSKSGKTLYMGLDAASDKVKLVKAQKDALAYKVTEANGSVIVFETKDGRFLHVPSALVNYGKTSSGSNLTDEKSDLNDLTLTKFKASDVTENETAPSELYGKLTIQGKLDKNEDDGSTPTVYARFSYDGEGRISTTASQVPLAFTSVKSNAFILIETTEPVDNVDIIYPVVGLRPDAIDNAGDPMELVVYGPASTTIVNASLIFFTKRTEGEDNNQKIEFAGTILTPTETPNTFTVNTIGLEPGMYNIVMEKGAFEFTAPQGKYVYNFDLSRELTIRGGVTPPPSGDIDPLASLSPTTINKAGDEMVLTIGNVNKAILKTPTAPYFVYDDGEKMGQRVEYTATILTAKANRLADFDVATSGLDGGKYILIMPAGTFTFEANDPTKVVTDKELRASFTVKNSDAPATNFSETLTNVSFINPSARSSSVIFKDVILNDLVVYAYKFDVSGLVPGTGKVRVKSTMWGNTVIEGKLVKYNTMQQDYGAIYGMDFTEVYALRFVPDTPLMGGELDNAPGIYGFFLDVAAMGDANYGKWLNNPNSVAPSACRVNPEMAGPTFQINNDTGTGIETVILDNTDTKDFYDLQGRRVDNISKKGVYIINGKKVVIK